MKKYLLSNLIITILFLYGGASFAATYNATGNWTFDTDETIIQIVSFSYTIPSVTIGASITQYSNDTFYLVTDSIDELGGISFDESGVIQGAYYDFDPDLSETGNPYDYNEELNMDLTVILPGFTLSSDDDLTGTISVYGYLLGNYTHITDIDFVGTKAVPVPGALLLLGSGFVCLAGVVKRNKK